MISTPHVLKNVRDIDVIKEPFPHIIIENALSPELARQLIESYPSEEIVSKGNQHLSNERFSYSAVDVLNDKTTSPLWKEFISKHVSEEFLHDVLRIFHKNIQEVYPDFEKRFGPLEEQKVGIRKIDPKQTGRILTDAQICINTPVIERPTSVKVAHLDKENKLFAGLLYLRHPDDDSTGGELLIYKYKNNNFRLHGPRFIEDQFVEKVGTIPYKTGNLIFFLNSIDSIHGVTVRQKTPHTRRFVNLVMEMPGPLFDLSDRYENKFQKLIRVFRKRVLKRIPN